MNAPSHADRYMPFEEVLERMGGISKSTFYRMPPAERPPLTNVTARRVGLLESTWNQWAANRAERQRGADSGVRGA
jgi:predicted DNA-binding transcriptional regulator AlpA